MIPAYPCPLSANTHTHTHTHTYIHTNKTPKHKTHTRPCTINAKTKKIKKVKDFNVKKSNGKPDELWCYNTLQFLVTFKNN